MNDVIPEMPGPVKVFLRDGSSFGAEVIYDGFKDGIHHWLITSTIPDDELDHIEVDVLPSYTSLTVPMRHGS